MPQNFDIRPLSPALGAEIVGLDVTRPIDGATVAELVQAWIDHLLLLFRKPDMTQEEQLRFAACFGKVGERPRPKEYRPEDFTALHAAFMLISNIREDGKPIGSLPDGEMMFHSDGAYAKRPFRYTLLYAMEIPSRGGNTMFSNMYEAYATLPDDLKQRLADCHGEHQYYAGTVQKDKPSDSLTGVRTHPLFIKHEETGRTALYASRLLTTRIPELSPTESDAVLEALEDLLEAFTLLDRPVHMEARL